MYFFATLPYLPIASWKASHSTHLSICYQTFLEGSPWSPKLLQICRHIVTSYGGEVSFKTYTQLMAAMDLMSVKILHRNTARALTSQTQK